MCYTVVLAYAECQSEWHHTDRVNATTNVLLNSIDEYVPNFGTKSMSLAKHRLTEYHDLKLINERTLRIKFKLFKVRLKKTIHRR